MRGTSYNRIAGQNISRLEAFSDGIFAVATTLLALDIHAPAAQLIHGEADLQAALLALLPRVFVWLLSFMTLGIFWMGQQTLLHATARGNRDFTWLQLGFLVCVTLMPFSTQLMAEFITLRTALLLYRANSALLGGFLLVSWRVAFRDHLLEQDERALHASAVYRRIIIAQSLYAFGAALCVFGTAWSIGFIMLVQLNYVLSPRLGFLQRL